MENSEKVHYRKPELALLEKTGFSDVRSSQNENNANANGIGLLGRKEPTNELVPPTQGYLAYKNIKTQYFYNKGRKDNNNYSREKERRNATLASRTFVLREISQFSSAVVMVENRIFKDVGRNYDAKGSIIERYNHHNYDFERVFVDGSQGLMQHKVFASRSVSEHTNGYALPYFAVNIDNMTAGVLYNRDNDANNKPTHSSYDSDSIEIRKNRLSLPRFSWENLGNSSDSWQPCFFSPLAGYKRRAARPGVYSSCHWLGDNSSVLVCSLDLSKALIFGNLHYFLYLIIFCILITIYWFTLHIILVITLIIHILQILPKSLSLSTILHSTLL